jgi:hypothetical protein
MRLKIVLLLALFMMVVIFSLANPLQKGMAQEKSSCQGVVAKNCSMRYSPLNNDVFLIHTQFTVINQQPFNAYDVQVMVDYFGEGITADTGYAQVDILLAGDSTLLESVDRSTRLPAYCVARVTACHYSVQDILAQLWNPNTIIQQAARESFMGLSIHDVPEITDLLSRQATGTQLASDETLAQRNLVEGLVMLDALASLRSPIVIEPMLESLYRYQAPAYQVAYQSLAAQPEIFPLPGELQGRLHSFSLNQIILEMLANLGDAAPPEASLSLIEQALAFPNDSLEFQTQVTRAYMNWAAQAHQAEQVELELVVLIQAIRYGAGSPAEEQLSRLSATQTAPAKNWELLELQYRFYLERLENPAPLLPLIRQAVLRYNLGHLIMGGFFLFGLLVFMALYQPGSEQKEDWSV